LESISTSRSSRGCVYPFAEAPDALRYVEDGHPNGKVVVTVAGGETGRRPQPAA
jgi:hypothetical protein